MSYYYDCHRNPIIHYISSGADAGDEHLVYYTMYQNILATSVINQNFMKDVGMSTCKLSSLLLFFVPFFATTIPIIILYSQLIVFVVCVICVILNRQTL